MFDLSGEWTLTEVGGDITVPITLPGDVHSALLAAGLIADPYYGRNEYAARWVAERDWLLTRQFRVEDPAEYGLMVLSGVDTIAEVRLNGTVVLSPASSFREYAADVSGRLVPGNNRLEILIVSSLRVASALQASQPFHVPYHDGNSPLANGNMLRKPQCDFGWDWNIALAPLGVYGRMELVGRTGEIGAVTVRQTHAGGAVTLRVAAGLRGYAVDHVDWTAEISGVSVAGTVELSDGQGTFVAELHVDRPELWWPNGCGPQTRHVLHLRAGSAERIERVALRDVRLRSEPDAAGRSFGFLVNGRAVFARGANWIPADALPGRITPEKTAALLRSAADANMNMIRVWGGGRYEPDWFYDLCDELGLMVWQDCMFACNLYPATLEFLGEIASEIDYQARRLAHRVALWCGDNELLGALTWFEESRKNRDRYLVAYDRLNRTVEQALKRALPEANWWPSSPSPGPMSYGDAWHDDGSGDMHFWSVWHEGRDFEHYRDVRPRFCSEFGFQSYPSIGAIRSFAAGDDLNIASPVMESHQKNAGGNARIAETMFRYFRFPKDFENFVWLSQIQQGLAIKMAVEFWRSLKPHCMGTLYWQLNDTWPVASWSSLDYGGGWKLLHYMARRFYQPVALSLIPDGHGALSLMGVNDRLEPVTVDVELSAVTIDGVSRRLSPAATTLQPEASSMIATLPDDIIADDEVLVFRWRASDGTAGEGHHIRRHYKDLALRPARLRLDTRVKGDVVEVHVAAEALALYVTIEANVPGRFSDNAVLVAPGHDFVAEFRPDRAAPEEVGFVVRDLQSSYSTL